jgi:hypothetical protein
MVDQKACGQVWERALSLQAAVYLAAVASYRSHVKPFVIRTRPTIQQTCFASDVGGGHTVTVQTAEVRRTTARLPDYCQCSVPGVQHVPECMVTTSAVRYEGPYRRLPHKIKSPAQQREQLIL